MANTSILLKRSGTSGNTPLTLEHGELSINYADGILFYKNDLGSINQIKNSDSFSTINVNSTLLISTSPSDILSITGNNGIIVSGNSSTDTIIIDVDTGTTSHKGVVQLYDGVDSNSTELAATTNSVNTVFLFAKSAYDTANSINVSSVDTWARDRANSAYNEANSKIDLLTEADFLSNNISTVSNSANQVIDMFSTSLYRSVKYLIQVTSSTDYQISEILLIHNGSDSFITEYGTLTTNGTLASYDSDINSSNVRLLISPNNNVNDINIVKTLISV